MELDGVVVNGRKTSTKKHKENNGKIGRRGGGEGERGRRGGGSRLPPERLIFKCSAFKIMSYNIGLVFFF
jgi:hypothetical protein